MSKTAQVSMTEPWIPSKLVVRKRTAHTLVGRNCKQKLQRRRAELQARLKEEANRAGLLGRERGRVRVRVGITVDLESTAAEEWNADAVHAAAPLRTAAAACISWLAPQRRRGGPREKTSRRADGCVPVCLTNICRKTPELDRVQ
jgi:hypothetical protein